MSRRDLRTCHGISTYIVLMSSAGMYELGVSVRRGYGGDDWEGGVVAMSGLKI